MAWGRPSLGPRLARHVGTCGHLPCAGLLRFIAKSASSGSLGGALKRCTLSSEPKVALTTEVHRVFPSEPSPAQPPAWVTPPIPRSRRRRRAFQSPCSLSGITVSSFPLPMASMQRCMNSSCAMHGDMQKWRACREEPATTQHQQIYYTVVAFAYHE